MSFRQLSLIAALVLSQNAIAASQEQSTAGVTPHQRPAGAPVITAVTRDSNWYSQALKGIEEPYPYSLRFLEDQGNWYNPFNHPGMTGPYDVRDWHRKN